ncbi:MAG: InlB B-repeat-containing protein [Bacilli bacterium]|nr:InlB B-repeat-containing protein [Bacilli bacterium]
MKNKGYTLIEVLGVIIILSLIIAIVVPSISSILTNSKDKAYNVQILEIESAAKSWGLLNSENLPTDDNGTIVISLLQLKVAHLLSSDFSNPKTGDLFPDDMQILITRKGQNLFYDVLTDTGLTNEEVNPDGPQIILKGSISTSVEINGVYTELGAIAKDNDGNDIPITIMVRNSIGEVVDAVDTSSVASYVITYSATSNSIISSIRRNVSIVDTEAPVITISGYTDNQYISIAAISGYTLPIASVTDNSNEILTYEVLGNFSSIIPGSKQVIYQATDNSGNIGKFILNYVVTDTEAPVISIDDSLNTETGRNQITVTAYDDGVGLDEYAFSFDGGVTWKKENTYVYKLSEATSLAVVVRDKVGNKTYDDSRILTVNPNGGVWNSSSSTQYLSVIANDSFPVEDPTRVGYSFSGWVIEGEGSFNETTFTMGEINTMITATWSGNSYLLTVNPNGGTWNGTTENSTFMKVVGSETTIAAPTRTDYVFVGWSVLGTDSSIDGNIFTMGVEEASLTAIWVKTVVTYAYSGSIISFTPTVSGLYMIELWGAAAGAGGGGLCSGGAGGAAGKGGYVSASATLDSSLTYSIAVGGAGTGGGWGSSYGIGGYNGGVNGQGAGGVSGAGGGGGGATTFKLGSINYLYAKGGGAGGGGADGGYTGTTCGGCDYRTKGYGGGYGGAGGGGTTGGAGAPNSCGASGYAGNSGNYYLNATYMTYISSTTGARSGNGYATITFLGM